MSHSKPPIKITNDNGDANICSHFSRSKKQVYTHTTTNHLILLPLLLVSSLKRVI